MQEENTIDKATIEAAARDLSSRFYGDEQVKWEDILPHIQLQWLRVGEYFVCVCTNANALSAKAFNEMFDNQ